MQCFGLICILWFKITFTLSNFETLTQISTLMTLFFTLYSTCLLLTFLGSYEGKKTKKNNVYEFCFCQTCKQALRSKIIEGLLIKSQDKEGSQVPEL